jgi:hypothetical protein
MRALPLSFGFVADSLDSHVIQLVFRQLHARSMPARGSHAANLRSRFPFIIGK